MNLLLKDKIVRITMFSDKSIIYRLQVEIKPHGKKFFSNANDIIDLHSWFRRMISKEEFVSIMKNSPVR